MQRQDLRNPLVSRRDCEIVEPAEAGETAKAAETAKTALSGEQSRCRAHSKRTGGPCGGKPVGRTGLCRMHGGTSIERSIEVNTKHGLYARIVPEHLLANYEDAYCDPQLTRLEHEIALLRAYVMWYVSRQKSETSITENKLDILARQVERLGSLVVKHARLRYQEEHVATKGELTTWIRMQSEIVREILVEFLPDPEVCCRAADKMRALMIERGLIRSDES